MPVPRRALLSVSDKTGLVEFGRGLVGFGFELVSTGGTARALREAGLPVTDVAAVTGFPEMLDGRVKTLHPRVHAGILADRRLVDHRQQLAAAAIAPFELVVVNLYPFAAAADRPGITFDALVEEIDIGGPSMVRAAAKNHASVAVVTIAGPLPGHPRRPGRGGERPARAAVGAGDRGVPSHGRLRRPDRGRAAGSDGRRRRRYPTNPACPGRGSVSADPDDRAREGRDAPLRREPAPTGGALSASRRDGEPGPFAAGQSPIQGKTLSYNNVLDASAVATLPGRCAGRAA